MRSPAFVFLTYHSMIATSNDVFLASIFVGAGGVGAPAPTLSIIQMSQAYCMFWRQYQLLLAGILLVLLF